MTYTVSERGKLDHKQRQSFVDDIKTHGGFTAYLYGRKNVGKRYVIGLQGFTVPLELLNGTHVQAIRTIAGATPEGSGFGAWLEESTVFFDVITSTDDPFTALEIAESHEQKAIYDSARNENLYVPIPEPGE